MPRSRTYNVEMHVSGYVEVEVDATTEEIAERKARKLVKKGIVAIRAVRPKHSPIIDEHIIVDDIPRPWVEEVDRG